MPPIWLVAGVAAIVFAARLLMPWARKRDAKNAARREAEGKPRSAIPPWALAFGCIAAVIGGLILVNSH